MTLQETKKRIEEIENYDYENFSNEDYRYILKKMGELFDGGLSLLIPKFPTENLRVFRCRENKQERLFQYERELWHPPARLTPHGRLNFQNKPILYTSHNAATAMIEIDAYKIQYFTTAEYKINTNNIRAIEFGLQTITDEHREILDPRTKILMDFINREAKKTIPKDQIQYYCPTMIYATSISQSKNFDAYVYESVATNHKGMNYAFKPRFAEKHIEPVEFRYIKVIEAQNSNLFKVECIYKSTSIDKGVGKINWEKVNDCDGHHINSSEFVYHDTSES